MRRLVFELLGFLLVAAFAATAFAWEGEMAGLAQPIAVVQEKAESGDYVVVVNAETAPDPAIDLISAAPSLLASVNLVSGSQIRRYNFETMLLSRSVIHGFGDELSTPEKRVTSRLVEVSFDALADPDERDYFKHLPTSFKLSDEQVDRLRAVGRQLLLESPEFQDLLRILRSAGTIGSQ